MENSLRRLRKAAGYKSAASFAEKVGIPAPTYARYEQIEDGPETSMPIKNAWLIADELGCSIDQIVGRSAVKPERMRGKVQIFYDDLSYEGKLRCDEFFDYIAYMEDKGIELKREREEIQWIQKAQQLERMFFAASVEDPDKSDIALWSPSRCRREFESFVSRLYRKQIAETRDETYDRLNAELRLEAGLATVDDDGIVHFKHQSARKEAAARQIIEEATDGFLENDLKEVMEQIMKAYDKVHPTEPRRLGGSGLTEYAIISLDKQ